MQAWFASGRVLDGIIALMAFEAAVLAWLWRRGRGVPPQAMVLNLLSGMAMLLAWRVWLGGAWWGWVSLCLLLGGAFHAADLRRLWRSS